MQIVTSLSRFVEAARSVRVLVVGDCMLDAYVSGVATRISPEAPVPVVQVRRRSYVPGGAGNVAANAASLGARVLIAGVVGSDGNGERLKTVLTERGLDVSPLIADASRVTTTKSRVTVGGHQLVRFDDEDTSPIPENVFASLRETCSAALDNSDACVVSDYAKGVFSEEFCRWLISEARLRGLPIVVDPKNKDFSRYAGATVVTPNLKEVAEACAGFHVSGLDEAAKALLAGIAPSALLVTRGEEGMSLFEAGMPERHLAAMVNEVADVTGAGDTVVAALAVALAAGFELFDAARIANLAAGVAVSHYGTWAVRAEELLQC